MIEFNGSESVPPMYLETYSRYENVYFRDCHVSIMTSHHAKITPYIRHLGSVILDFKNVQKCQKISKFDLEKSKKYKDAKTVHIKIMEETLRKSDLSTRPVNTWLPWKVKSREQTIDTPKCSQIIFRKSHKLKVWP